MNAPVIFQKIFQVGQRGMSRQTDIPGLLMYSSVQTLHLGQLCRGWGTVHIHSGKKKSRSTGKQKSRMAAERSKCGAEEPMFLMGQDEVI